MTGTACHKPCENCDLLLKVDTHHSFGACYPYSLTAPEQPAPPSGLWSLFKYYPKLQK
jgi:hypothetical protein